MLIIGIVRRGRGWCHVRCGIHNLSFYLIYIAGYIVHFCTAIHNSKRIARGGRGVAVFYSSNLEGYIFVYCAITHVHGAVLVCLRYMVEHAAHKHGVRSHDEVVHRLIPQSPHSRRNIVGD